MKQTELIAEILERSLGMLQRTLADFADKEMFVRPVPAANHAAWMLGHLCASETRMMGLVKPDVKSVLPDGFAEKFNSKTAGENDPAKLADKATLLSTFEKVRQQTITIARQMPDEELSRQIPSPFAKGTMTTVGFMMHMPALHGATHLGQMQVIRRALGKPVLF